ncbi:unnamed protein product [Anisakis simplex]|uniref:Single-stranded DNA-binding protein, mitochondrial (inferred by orthology to a C. elegans protein) n=1 Tax=Anisakis simplex TaxID=6269 RepID=A0A0M3JRM0_ANISI|nr:unnamed protein product [Anisakis simplex]
MKRSLIEVKVVWLQLIVRSLASAAQETPKTDAPKESVSKQQQQPSKDDIDQLFSASDDSKTRRRHAFSINRVELIGGVSDEPIQRVARSGSDYVTFNMITNMEFRRPDGERNDQSEMHSISVFGRAAEFVMRNVQKGTRVFVSGRLHYQPMTREDGTRMGRMATINAETVQPLAKLRMRNADDSEMADTH